MDKFPEFILDANNTLVPTASLKDHVVALYFSAHWCPPCRQFTPRLSAWYKNFCEKHPEKKFSIVFVSSDKTQADFDGYRKEMSFHALPFEHRDLKGQLSTQFKVRGIPTMIVLNTDNSIITRDGRAIVDTDQDGNQFPWIPKPFAEEMAGPLLSAPSKQDAEYPSSIEGKHVVFYFSAHWCGPCRKFTPVLVEMYKKLQAAGRPFEVIFVSGDNSDEEFDGYFGEMPWKAIPYGDPRIEFLNRHFEVDGIPTAVLVGPTGNVIDKDFRSIASNDPDGADFPWPAKPVVSLGRSIGQINDIPTLLAFTDGSVEQVAAATSAMQASGEAELAAIAAEHRDPKIQFGCSQGDEEDQSDSLRKFLKLSDVSPLLVLVDVDNGRKHVHEGPFTADTVRVIVEGFNAGTLAMVGLRG